MNLSEEQAIAKGEKVLRDIGFWDSDIELPSAKFFEQGAVTLFGEGVPAWLVSFAYGAEDYGKDVAHLLIVIEDSTGTAIDISYRNGYVKLEYDKTKDLYSKKE